MIEARWFSTVRWLMPRSAAMFLLGWPARTSSMIWRCRGVRSATWFAASSPPGGQLARIPRLFERALDAGEQFVAADRLFDEVRSAGLHGLNRHRHVAVAGDHDGRQPMARIVEPLQQFEPVHSGQVGIDQQACFAARTIGFEECLAGRDNPRRSGHLPRARARIASRTWLSSSTTKMTGGPELPAASAGCGARGCVAALRRWQETLDDLRQLLQLHRLVELHTVLQRDIAQGAGRDVTGQNDDRDLAMKLLPQLRGDLQPVHAVRQIVVRKDEVRPDRPSRHQFQRRDAVRRRCRAMAFVLEDQLEEFAHFGIVLDDQDRAGAANAFDDPVIYARADGVHAAAPFRSVAA